MVELWIGPGPAVISDVALGCELVQFSGDSIAGAGGD